MRKCFLALCTIMVPILSFGDWDIEVPCSDSSGKSAAIGLDNNNDPHILYFVDGDQFYHIYKSDSLWYGPYPIEGVNYSTLCRMIDIAMVRDTANAVMSLEYTATGDYLLWGKHMGNGVWSTQQIPNTIVPSNSGGYLNVAISPGSGSSLFHIIYVHYNYGSPVLYYRKYDSTWTDPEEVSYVPDVSSGWQHDIAVDANDDPHITFVYSEEGIKYRKKTSGAWEPIELVSTATDPSFTSIAVDGADYPHIAYDKDDFEAVCYRAKTASGWQSEETIGAGGGWNTYGASIVCSGGEYFVAYYADGDLKFAMRAITGWVSEEVDTVGDVGTHTSLAIDNDGYAHIAYRDATNELLKYAKSTEPVVGIVEAGWGSSVEPCGLSLHAYPNPFSNQSQIRFAIHDSGYMVQEMQKQTLKIYDASGRFVKDFCLPTTYCLLSTAVFWDGTDSSGRKLPNGVYFVRLNVHPMGNNSTGGEIYDYSITGKLLLIE